MKLGGQPILQTEGDVARAAGEVEDGFVPKRTSIARAGNAALARDASGRIMIVKQHGSKFAGRILSGESSAKEEVDALILDIGEARFGTVRLSLSDASYWADAINRL